MLLCDLTVEVLDLWKDITDTNSLAPKHEMDFELQQVCNYKCKVFLSFSGFQ